MASTAAALPFSTRDRIAFDRLGLVACSDGAASRRVVGALLGELAHVGVRVTNPEALTDGFVGHYRGLVDHVRRQRGGYGTYSPLFSGFPERLPDFDDGALRFLVGAIRLLCSRPLPEAGALPQWTDDEIRSAMDFSELGWWPASSVPQDVAQARLDREVQRLLPADTRVEWLDVTAVSGSQLDEALVDYMATCFASSAALRADEVADLRKLVAIYGTAGIDAETVRLRENRTLLFELAWHRDPAAIVAMAPTPDDLLRMLAGLAGGDVSLSSRVRFARLSRPQRRVIIDALERSDRLGDVFRRRGLWLALDRGLHVGSYCAPRVQETFAHLRQSRHDKTSLRSRYEAALADSTRRPDDSSARFCDAVSMVSAEAPGLFARELRRLAHRADGVPRREEALVAALSECGGRLGLKVLLSARSQLADNGATYPRAAFSKSGSALVIDYEPGHLRITDAFRRRLVRTLGEVISSVAAGYGDWTYERVYIAPELDSVFVPDQLRTTSAGLVQVERGSRLPMGEAPVLRMFVHWKERDERTDLDLSCMALDEDLKLVEHVSWTRLASRGMVHSGDITSAPDGAEEFIDVDLAQARGQSRWRYLVPAVFRFDGDTFDGLAEANVGWMLRDRADSNRATFDPATVVNAFELTGTRRTALPIVFDLETGEACYIDVYLNGKHGARVERDAERLAILAKAVMGRAAVKESVTGLAGYHAFARGAWLEDVPERATITFGLGDEYTYNALRPEKLLAELL